MVYCWRGGIMLVAMVGCNNIDSAFDVIVQIVGQAESDAGIQCYLFCMRNRGNVAMFCNENTVVCYNTDLFNLRIYPKNVNAFGYG